MKLRRSLRMFNLKRPRLRQSWNKINLYNLSRVTPSPTFVTRGTLFQQKWRAKAMSRGYHGEHIKERQWERMFSRRLDSVVDMNPAYMAQFDGSEQATGRGSGKTTHPDDDRAARPKPMTPYMQMTFAPMERRLDVAVFRALFASSARQARQFVVHGAVKVNGKKMIYPGYLLNPGDMFQVNPDLVMWATGRPKAALPEDKRLKRRAEKQEDTNEVEEEVKAAGDAEVASDESAADLEGLTPEVEAEIVQQNKDRMKQLLNIAKDIAATTKSKPTKYGKDGTLVSGLTAKRRIKLRAFIKTARAALSRAGRKSSSVDDTTFDVKEMTSLLEEISTPGSSTSTTTARATEETAQSAEEAATTNQEVDEASSQDFTMTTESDHKEELTLEQRQRIARLLENMKKNPHPGWQLRRWAAPFIFIPRYLEVNQRICSAVYLRHPVARPGSSEVPTPFPEEVGQLAFNWYLRRR